MVGVKAKGPSLSKKQECLANAKVSGTALRVCP